MSCSSSILLQLRVQTQGNYGIIALLSGSRLIWCRARASSRALTITCEDERFVGGFNMFIVF